MRHDFPFRMNIYRYVKRKTPKSSRSFEERWLLFGVLRPVNLQKLNSDSIGDFQRFFRPDGALHLADVRFAQEEHAKA